MPELISLSLLLTVFKIVGGVGTCTGFIFGVFKVISWIKAKFISIDQNVVDMKNSMDSHITGLREEIKNQTTTLAGELREQRQDFRTFYAPTLLHMLQNNKAQETAPVPVRARKQPIKIVKKKRK